MTNFSVLFLFSSVFLALSDFLATLPCWDLIICCKNSFLILLTEACKLQMISFRKAKASKRFVWVKPIIRLNPVTALVHRLIHEFHFPFLQYKKIFLEWGGGIVLMCLERWPSETHFPFDPASIFLWIRENDNKWDSFSLRSIHLLVNCRKGTRNKYIWLFDLVKWSILVKLCFENRYTYSVAVSSTVPSPNTNNHYLHPRFLFVLSFLCASFSSIISLAKNLVFLFFL